MQWVFSVEVSMEIDKIMQVVKDEFVQKDSNFPYGIGLGLIKKSAYSASVNQRTHILVHLTGSLMGEQRSVNAILLNSAGLTPLVINAAIMYWQDFFQ